MSLDYNVMSIKESELLNKMIGCLVDQIAHGENELDVDTFIYL